ncbi:hypothetical protein MMC29_004128 [Sticta canariensis]|nr:hypothetical protein [Sticta canariensis]
MSEDPCQSPPSTFLTRESNRQLMSVLSAPSAHRRALPRELILQILSHPSRWVLAWSDKIIDPTSLNHIEHARILLSTPALTARSARLLREVVFTIRSHDQGWSSFPEHHGTFENSWTWFEAVVLNKSEESGHATNVGLNSIDIFDSTNVRRHHLQSNRHAIGQAEDHTISIGRGHEIFNGLKAEDRILLVAFAQYSGWVNHIQDAKIEILEEDDLNE